MNRARRNFILHSSGALLLQPKYSEASFLDKLFKNNASKDRSNDTPRVLVVGAGFGGSTFSIYLKKWYPSAIITVIEQNRTFTSTIFSNGILSGTHNIKDITLPYVYVNKLVDEWIMDSVTSIDSERRTVTISSGRTFPYDRLVLSGGIELLFDKIQGYDSEARKTIMHAWNAGPQTTTLRKQLEEMPDGGTFVMSVPMAPFRCPPAPYERVCQVAAYLSKAKPKSKIIVLDGNPDIASNKHLFLAAWTKHYGYGTPNSMIEYRPNNMPRSVDSKKMIVGTEFDVVKGDVINLVPPMRAAAICQVAGVRSDSSGTWCPIDYRSFESLSVKNIHVLGDSTLTNFPKSGSIANNMAKVCAYAMAEIFYGREPDTSPVIINICYSAASESTAFHVAIVFRYSAADGNNKFARMIAQKGGGFSREESELEYAYMESWAKNVLADTLGLPG